MGSKSPETPLTDYLDGLFPDTMTPKDALDAIYAMRALMNK